MWLWGLISPPAASSSLLGKVQHMQPPHPIFYSNAPHASHSFQRMIGRERLNALFQPSTYRSTTAWCGTAWYHAKHPDKGRRCSLPIRHSRLLTGVSAEFNSMQHLKHGRAADISPGLHFRRFQRGVRRAHRRNISRVISVEAFIFLCRFKMPSIQMTIDRLSLFKWGHNDTGFFLIFAGSRSTRVINKGRLNGVCASYFCGGNRKAPSETKEEKRTLIDVNSSPPRL